MRIYIQNMMSKTYVLNLNEEVTKGIDIKKKIEGFDGVDVSKQTLVYKGQIVEDEKFLNEYSIQEDDKIHYLVKFVECSCKSCEKRI